MGTGGDAAIALAIPVRCQVHWPYAEVRCLMNKQKLQPITRSRFGGETASSVDMRTGASSSGDDSEDDNEDDSEDDNEDDAAGSGCLVLGT